MNELKIKEAKALTAYDKGDKNTKELLINLFGTDLFNRSITDRVKTFEDACEVLGIDPDNITPNDGEPEDLTSDQNSINAYCKLIVIAKALNEDWKPNWENSNEYKYYPWFKMKSGFGFSNTYCTLTGTGTDIGSRLCFKTSDLAEYAGKQFEAIYQDYLTL